MVVARCVISFFYIKPQLLELLNTADEGCVISFFYIKPQLLADQGREYEVVLYPSSTSNHNELAGP